VAAGIVGVFMGTPCPEKLLRQYQKDPVTCRTLRENNPVTHGQFQKRSIDRPDQKKPVAPSLRLPV